MAAFIRAACLTGAPRQVEGGVANLQDELSKALRGRPTGAAKPRGENATILHNFNQTTLAALPEHIAI